MEFHEVIIVGGGPAGSTCAWKLKHLGVDCAVIDKAEFPRTKLCAGWITPEVIKDLEIVIPKYPHSILRLPSLYAHFYGFPIRISAPQYSIRRYEFDHWLLLRADVPVIRHETKQIERKDDQFIIDEKYSCRYLVGAGGTFCPVYRTFFSSQSPRAKNKLIVCRELEYPTPISDEKCYLWFFENKLPGYSWYVPKANGYLNIGVGGLEEKLKRNGDSINNHWDFLLGKLRTQSLIFGNDFRPKGHSYYLREPVNIVHNRNAFIIGDAAGLATRDMGEGIGPAVKSGILAAESISSGKPFDINSISAFSLHHPLFLPILKLLMRY
ncbi:NAD(P)/FAD-dependent oxidoreductase [bacterium]|nr:MAG: NAD(P)/FAD-dependent oxidoreductase [bacterium]